MQVRIDIENPTLENAHHPLGKLQFVADTIMAVHTMKNSDGFFEFNNSGLYGMGELVQECVDELHFLINKSMGIDSDKGERITTGQL